MEFNGGLPLCRHAAHYSLGLIDSLSDLERAVLSAIALQIPESTDRLMLQQREAAVLARENTGSGFFTTLDVPPGTPTIDAKSPVGDVGATIAGLEHGVGFLLWLVGGHTHQLEGYAYGNGNTSSLDFEQVDFGLVQPRAEL